MKALISLLFTIVQVAYLYGQVSVNIQPSQCAAIGYHDTYNTADNNYNNADQFAAYCIPGGASGVNINRGLIQFDLSGIPSGATIISASLFLFKIPPIGTLVNHTIGNNTCFIQRVTNAWNEINVTWNTQPSAVATDQATLAPSVTGDENYTVNVTQLVQYHVNNPSQNFGYLFRLEDESINRIMMFTSDVYPDQSLHPFLNVVYCSEIPEISISATGPTHFCEGEEVSLIVNANVPFNWNDGSSQNPRIVSTNGVFSVSSTEGCIVSSNSIEIIVDEEISEARILGSELINVCFPDEVILQSSESSYNLWSTGETSQSISVGSAGLYTLTRSNICNTVMDTVVIVDASVDASFDLLVPPNAYLPVTVQVSNFESGCNWFLQGVPLILDGNNSFVVSEETAYVIEHQCDNDLGCSDKVDKTFNIELPSEFYIPNAFTPNGDGDNDIFLPKGFKIEKLSMLIFNRWGELIFESNDVNLGWDGSTKTNQIAPEGVYTCLIKALDVYEKKYEHIGSVHLLK
ncbi:MAG: DNRLRE domain-containing protein [Bacteroidetes bacterium]|nr:DNRLRE domain-containing protein [Bacteroidota bacterium]